MGGTYKAPDMAAANREAVYAQAQTFPVLRQIEAASRTGGKGSYPIYDAAGQVLEGRPYDFSGISDIDVTRETARALAALAPEQTKAQRDLSKLYGTQLPEQIHS